MAGSSETQRQFFQADVVSVHRVEKLLVMNLFMIQLSGKPRCFAKLHYTITKSLSKSFGSVMNTGMKRSENPDASTSSVGNNNTDNPNLEQVNEPQTGTKRAIA